jgi:hypothetical protein
MPYKDKDVKKSKQKTYSAAHYNENKERVKRNTKAKNKEKMNEWNAFKASLSCLECGIDYPAVLDFHHVAPELKSAAVHKLVQARRLKAAMEEVEKCIVLCANCHRYWHYMEREKEKGAEAPAKK